MSIINKIHGSSLVSTSINVPLEFGIKTLSTKDGTLKFDKNIHIKTDEYNIPSILEIDTIPYIDYSKYDDDRRMWYEQDQYGSLWRKYNIGDWIIELEQESDKVLYFSMENLCKQNYEAGLRPTDVEFLGLKITPFEPISLSITGLPYSDITDYSLNVIPTLDFIVPEINRAFYFKNKQLHTNIDLSFYDIQQIDVRYDYTISYVKVHNIMHTNTTNYSNYTPIVDYYMLKLTGQ